MVDAVLEIMQKAVIPWSNVVEKLVQHYLETKGPKCVTESFLLFFSFLLSSLILKILVCEYFYSQTRTCKGELHSDGNQEASEKLRDTKFQPPQPEPNSGKEKEREIFHIFSNYILLSSPLLRFSDID